MLTKATIRPFTQRGKFFLAVKALPASNLEGSYHSLTHSAPLDSRPDLLNNTAEFMAQDVIFMQFRYGR